MRQRIRFSENWVSAFSEFDHQCDSILFTYPLSLNIDMKIILPWNSFVDHELEFRRFSFDCVESSVS